ncbi:MAG: TraB/GumN family protein [Crocinitomicaceae bacterium]|nr:TraB/GumN family protein [Crocinitomicaceae bacterium]
MVVVVFLLFAINAFAQTPSVDFGNKLLWEITSKNNKQKNYLYSSYHSNDKRVFDFCDSVYYALDNSKSIVLETDIYAMFKDWDTRQDFFNLNYDNQGDPYTNHSEATRTTYGSEDGMPQFLDLYFLQYGFNAGKDFYVLEPIEDQINLIDNKFDMSSPYYLSNYLGVAEKTIQLYLDGNIDAIAKMMQLGLKWNPEFYDKLIINRNVVMANGIDSLIKSGPLFISIGAAHLSGDKGVINLLREKGYQLRPVICSKSPVRTKEKEQVLSYKNYHYMDSITGLNVELPGKPFEIDKEGVVLDVIYREMGQGNTYLVEVIERLEGMTLESVADDYIQSPGDSKKKRIIIDNETSCFEGISDSYPEGVAWVRVIETDRYFAIMKAYGGNKFMNSNRSQKFFENVWFD